MSDEKKLELPGGEKPVESTAPAEPAAGSATAAGPGEGQAHSHSRMPPATLTLLVTSLGTQTLMSLGQIANPVTGKSEVDLDQARHCIDLLSMLEVKTANNRTTEESKLLDEMLYELRMLFVQSEK